MSISKVTITEVFETDEGNLVMVKLTGEILYDKRDGLFLEHVEWNRELYSGQENDFIRSRVYQPDVTQKFCIVNIHLPIKTKTNVIQII